MNDGMMLNALIAAVVLCGLALGAVRGSLREAMVGGSILFGGMLASLKAATWGDRIAGEFDVRIGLARFEAGLGILLGSWLLLGVLGSALCDRRVPSLSGRALGAALGAVNVALLVSVGLQLFERHYSDGEREAAFAESWVARQLVDRFDLLLVAGGAFLAFSVLGGHLLHRIIGVGYDAEIEPALTWVQRSRTRSRSVRIPVDADDGKIEPPHEDGRAWPHSGLTNSQPVVAASATRFEPDRYLVEARPEESPRGNEQELTDRAQSHEPEYGVSAHESILDRWLREAEESGPLVQGTVDSYAWTDHVPRLSASEARETTAQTSDRMHRCPECRTWLPDPTLPCPFCGDR
jgi:hypothetical protein